jgi:hypothetical protein
MANTSDLLELQAQITSLTRRFDRMESAIFGMSPLRYNLDELLGLYVDARRGPEIASDTASRQWAAVISKLDEVGLFLLAKHTRDPFPWRPFLLLLDTYTKEGYDIFTHKATNHILEVAENMMVFQGLTPLRPCDVLKTETRVVLDKTGLSALR